MLTQELLTLLEEAAVINKKYQRSHNNEFNLLTVSGAARREVQMCRVIGELLNPKGCHNMGTAFLESFFSDVLKMKTNDGFYDAAELATADVFLEYGIDDLRRIDIVIKTSERRVPIEVKIEAGDQEEQCADYLIHAENSPLYYLTIDGHLPSEYSISAEELVNVKVISWKEDIYSWIEDILKHADDTSFAFVLTQILDAIDRISGATEERMTREISKNLLTSKKRMLAAMSLEKGLIPLKTEFLSSIFTAVESKIMQDNILPAKLNNKYDYAKRIDTYYTKKTGSTYPGLSYRVTPDNKTGLQLWVRLELDHRMYVSLVVTDETGEHINSLQYQNDPFLKEFIGKYKESLDHSGFTTLKSSDWWLSWKYCNDIDYQSCNNAYIESIDENLQCKADIIKGYVDQITTLWNEANAIIDSCESI